ncbi:MAG: protein TolQ [Deltaproteobacteria bacterium]|nr:protein TolQ [Deltaproteobacteria bacterium]
MLSVREGRYVVFGVLILLVLLSVASWFIIVYKWTILRRAKRESEAFVEQFWQSRRLDAIYQATGEGTWSPVASLFRAGYVELSRLKKPEGSSGDAAEVEGGLENVERALRRASGSETTHLERLVPFLATIGSTAPFVGLFGTVWGIMDSFREIAVQQKAGLDTVAPGISEALIATAIGLVAAIPAVMAYNYFLAKIKVLITEMENFSNDFLNIVKRHFFK